MPRVNPKTISTLAKRVFGDVKEVPQIVQEGRRALHKGEGTHSMTLWPLMAALKKLKGKNKIDSALYDQYHRKLINANERLGRVLAQHGPSERMFSKTEIVPTKRKIKGLPSHVEHKTYSATAPLEKAVGVVSPLAAGMYVSEKVGAHVRGEPMSNDDAKTLMKNAASAIAEFSRRDQAIKLAMSMVERGKCEPFKSVSELEEKVASLMEKNLDAVREALDMDGELTDFGKVASPQTEVPAGSNRAEMTFFHRLSE